MNVSIERLRFWLLVGAGLLVKNFQGLLNVNESYSPRTLLTMNLTLPETQYSQSSARLGFFEQVFERLSAVPGVQASAIATNVPYSDGGGVSTDTFSIEGRPQSQRGELRNAIIQTNTTQNSILSSMVVGGVPKPPGFPSYFLGRGQCIAPEFLRVRERQGQGVGGVGRGRFRQVQESLHHFCDRHFLRRAVADDGLLHFARGDFVDVQAGLGGGYQRGAARLTHEQGRLQILRVEQSFHDADRGMMLPDHVAQGLRDFCQAPGVFPTRGTNNRAVGECLRMLVCRPNDAEACSA